MIPMVRKGAVVASASLALCLAAAACSSSSSSSSPSGGSSSSASSSSGTTVSISVAQFTRDFSAMSVLKPLASAGKGNVAVILPDTVTSARYVQFDAPYLTQALTAAGLSSSQFTVQNAQGSDATQLSDAQTAITKGATVLIMDPLDSGVGAQIETYAKAHGVGGHRLRPADPRRQPASTTSASTTSWSARRSARASRPAPPPGTSAKPNVLVMKGDPTDNNATLFAQGYLGGARSASSAGKYVKVGSRPGPGRRSVALSEFQQNFTAHKNINSVLIPNDANAAPIIHYLQTKGVKAKTFPVTGQDATTIGLQNILAGYQCGTVYKPIYLEAQAAAALAMFLRAGKTPPAALVNGSTNDSKSNTAVPSVLLTPKWVTTANMASTVVADKFVTVAQLCVGQYAPPVRRPGYRNEQQLAERKEARPVTNPSADDARPATAGRASGSPTSRTQAPRAPKRPQARRRGPGRAAAADARSAARPRRLRRAPAPAAAEPLLRLVGVGKNFGPVRALTDINLDVPVGQVTALVGDNGAGKSTLIKTISGIWQQDHGEILWEGKPVRLHTPKDAADLGIATVYQDLALADNLDIVQNMFLGREPVRHWVLDETTMEKTAKRTLADLSVVTVRSVRQPVGSLSGGQRQAVAVARAVLRQARLVILDEPTAALGVTQTRVVLELIRRLKSQGIAVIVISHNLNDVMTVADRVAVLRLGQLVSVGPLSQYDAQSIVDLMTTGTSKRLAACPGRARSSGSSSEH